jgi:hypothetical protein
LQDTPYIELSLLLPQEWKRVWGLTSDKSLSLYKAEQFGIEWPAESWTKKRGGIMERSHNLAESFLLAHFVREAHQQGFIKNI